jgi:hypothetical protein
VYFPFGVPPIYLPISKEYATSKLDHRSFIGTMVGDAVTAQNQTALKLLNNLKLLFPLCSPV